jgi:hypothetical protein
VFFLFCRSFHIFCAALIHSTSFSTILAVLEYYIFSAMDDLDEELFIQKRCKEDNLLNKCHKIISLLASNDKLHDEV